MQSPFGTVWLARSDLGLTHVVFSEEPGTIPTDSALSGSFADYAPDELADAVAQLDAYFDGTRHAFDLALDLQGYSPFQRRVLQAVSQVPYGTTRSYRDIAETIGLPLAARAVGGAIAVSHLSLVVPAHRIIKSDGSVGFYAYQWESRDRGVRRKLELLRHEGVTL
jgi:O-6-methylguanine DNA methyltransferase